MPGYLVLLAPSSNRVYAGAALEISAAEAEVVVSAASPTGFRGAEPISIAGVAYLAVTLADDVDPQVLGGLAATYAVFSRQGDLLRPVKVGSGLRLDDDLLTIPKYPGKTNEQLTRVLLNATLATTDLPRDHRLCVLDPLAGRGTTLSWALTLGYDAVGVEVEQREVEAYAAFLTTWLRRKRLKHRIGLTTLRRSGQRMGEVLEAVIGRDDPQSLVVHAADTMLTAELLQRRRVDVVVTDAPYGVTHGSRAGRGERERSPAELLAAGIPVWVSVLRAGGALGMAWNTHGLSRADLAEMCAGAGLEVCDQGPYARFAHRVDAGIHRDLLVARKPR